MGNIELMLIGIGLAMDAFAVSVCKGISIKKNRKKEAIKIGLYFGLFQAIMPLIGYLLGTKFCQVVESIDHWLAFIILSLIGINMIKDAKLSENLNNKTDIKTMLILSAATSIDALAIGITFAFLKVNIIKAISVIGIITFILSLTGVLISSLVKGKLKNKSEIFGGIMLILIGIKILLEGLKII